VLIVCKRSDEMVLRLLSPGHGREVFRRTRCLATRKRTEGKAPDAPVHFAPCTLHPAPCTVHLVCPIIPR